MPLSRRSLLGLFAAAPVAAVAAKLPASPAPMVLRYDVPVHEVYGRGPMMTATEVMRRHNEAIQALLEATKDINPLDCIDWDRVHQELGAYGIACIKEEEVDADALVRD